MQLPKVWVWTDALGVSFYIRDRVMVVPVFQKILKALVRIAQEHGASSRIVEAVIEVNEAQKARMIKKIRSALGGNESGKTIAVLGLTFKPETDDMRDAPSLAILPKLIENGCQINAHDPQGYDEAKSLLPSACTVL